MGIRSGRVVYSKAQGRRRAVTTVDFDRSTETGDLALMLKSSGVGGGERVTLALTAKTELELVECRMYTDTQLTANDAMFCNGYQSWSGSCEATLRDSEQGLLSLARPLLGMYGDYDFYPYRHDRLHSWTYTYIRDRIDRGGIAFYGSLNEGTGFTVFEYDKQGKTLQILKDCGGLRLTAGSEYHAFDLLDLTGGEEWVFDRYFEAMGTAKPRVGPCTGWTSWYQYYTAVTQQDVLGNLAAFRLNRLPVDFFQIDDGYQRAVGDWLLTNSRFPDGMAHLADEIHRADMKAGLWLAPIVCEKRSRLYRKHPDWVAAKAGFNPGWSGMFYALDFYNEGVRDYLHRVFDVVLKDWRYDMVKLDFLYAAALPPRRDRTRGQVMAEFMRFLREICGDSIILGCGVPLGSAFGLVDYCRIGSDVADNWEDGLLHAIGYRERVSTANSLAGTLGRRQLNGRAFLNDPDVFILRDSANGMTADQKRTLCMLNSVFGGLTFTSDSVGGYDEGKMALLRCLLESKGATVRSLDGRGALKVRYATRTGEFCLISNLTDEEACAYSPCAGNLAHCGPLPRGREHIRKGQMILLRPYQTVCLEVTDHPADGRLER